MRFGMTKMILINSNKIDIVMDNKDGLYDQQQQMDDSKPKQISIKLVQRKGRKQGHLQQ